MKAYVWNGSEVQLTGRQARKERISSGKSRSNRSFQSIDILHEIEPIDKMEGSWKKWIRMDELYEIVDEPEQNDNGTTSEESVSSGEEGGRPNGENG